MRWSEAVTLEFVKMYLKHECLWNPAHPGYKLKYQREKAYTDICTEFRSSTMKTLSIPEVKMKIKNLRTTYVQQVHKILQKSSPDCIYEPSLVWFHEMDQCLKHISSIRHTSFNNQESSDINSNQMWVENALQNSNSGETHALLLPTDDEYDLSIPVSKLKLDRHSTIVKRYQKRNKKIKLKHQKSTKDYSTDSSLDSMVIEDEFDIYGKFIASQLRKMNLQKAIQLQLEIQNLVSKARITDLNNT